MSHRNIPDTNVIVSVLRYRNGASFRLLSEIDNDAYKLVLSVPLLFEYEAVLKRQSATLGLSHEDIDDILDYICLIAERRRIHFLWRPHLRDPGDDMLLEIAVEAECEYIVTHNLRDFEGADQFAVQVITPQQLMQIIGIRP